MSPENVFAAQMWSWPDPMIKRDEVGRVVFLNAAFLSIYGGRVEDWQGNTVTGWPAPHTAQGINRFETNLATDNGEFIFDWLEYAHGEGYALAIARDVTAFIGRHAASVAPAPPVINDTAYEAQIAHQAAQDHVHQQNHAHQHDHAHEQSHAHQQNHVHQQNHASAQVAPTHDMVEQAPAVHVQQAAPAEQNSHYDAAPPPQPDVLGLQEIQPSFEVPPEVEAAPQTPVETVHAEQSPDQNIDMTGFAQMAPPEQPEVRERDIKRRALPIENQDSVLGTNWRDAVIARAVSSDDSVEESDETVEPSTPTGRVKEVEVSTSGHRILLAEDNAINALLTRTLLEAEGCTVDVVEDGALAVEAVKNANYDMIFMDMRMPNMDGLEATRKIRSLSNTDGNLPIIALTANAFDDDRNACFDSGMNDFMTKPVSAEELSAMVSTWAVKTEAAA